MINDFPDALFTAYTKLARVLLENFDFSDLDLSKTVLKVLMILRHFSVKHEKCLKMSDLEMLTGILKSTLTGAMDVLVRKNYVERIRSQEDRRVVMIKLTESGKEKTDELIDVLKKHINRKIGVLSDREIEELFNAFKTIERIAEKIKEGEHKCQTSTKK